MSVTAAVAVAGVDGADRLQSPPFFLFHGCPTGGRFRFKAFIRILSSCHLVRTDTHAEMNGMTGAGGGARDRDERLEMTAATREGEQQAHNAFLSYTKST
jgi:hypothetical protein